MDKDLIELIEDIRQKAFTDVIKKGTNENNISSVTLFYDTEVVFEKIFNIIKYYDDVKNGKWIKINNKVYPDDFGLDWVLVQFVERTGFVGLPYIAEYNREKDKWQTCSDDKAENAYINEDCIASSWKIIEPSPEWLENIKNL